jgi:hypothetical protein
MQRYVLCGAFVAASFVVFGRSLNYSFVYDDHPKIADNRSLDNLATLASDFFNPDRQSSDPELNRHTFRPLFVLLTGVERHVFGNRPAGFRAINILFHGLNALLVTLLAMTLFEWPVGVAVIAGVVFLVHPAQLEGVVWVVEQSNVICATLMLTALVHWVRYLRSGRKLHLVASSGLFVAGLFVRENALMFPLAAFAVAVYLARPQKIRIPSKPLVTFFVLAAGFFCLRSVLLHRTAQGDIFQWPRKPVWCLRHSRRRFEWRSCRGRSP